MIQLHQHLNYQQAVMELRNTLSTWLALKYYFNNILSHSHYNYIIIKYVLLLPLSEWVTMHQQLLACKS